MPLKKNQAGILIQNLQPHYPGLLKSKVTKQQLELIRQLISPIYSEHQLSRWLCNGDFMAIPNDYNFIFGLSDNFGGKPFSLIHYLAVASCCAVNHPRSISLYYEYEPSGVWWERAKPYITNLIKVEAPRSVFGNPIVHFAHKADVLRLQILLERGGIYLDADVLCLRPFTSLLCHDTVLAEELGVGLCNAVILARQHADFLGRWLAEYRTFNDACWREHSVTLPARLAKEIPSVIHVLDYRKFFPLTYRREDLIAFFLHPGSSFCAQSYCVHLWETLTWPLVGRLKPDDLWITDSEFCLISRPYLNSR